MLFYKVATLGFRCFFWLHQGMNTTSYVGILLLLAGAPKDRDGGICESPLPYPLDSNSSTEPRRRGSGRSLRRDIGLPRVYRDIGILYPLQTVYRHFDVRIGCFVFGLGLFAFQMVLLGLYRLFFIIGWKKDAVCVALTHVFWITADREMVPISFCASPFHQIGWAKSYCKNAFVRFRLLMIWFSIPLSTKTIDLTAVSANPTKDYGKNLK